MREKDTHTYTDRDRQTDRETETERERVEGDDFGIFLLKLINFLMYFKEKKRPPLNYQYLHTFLFF